MRFFTLMIVFVFTSIFVSAQKADIIKSPGELPENEERLKVFLGGSIDMGNAENWQAIVENELADENLILFNPRREDWNKDWEPIISDTNFREQVEWELLALEKADIIIMYFAPKSQSPISLLELGLYARTKKLMVVCPEGYWRKGNVDILCEKYRIETFDTIDSVIEEIKRGLK